MFFFFYQTADVAIHLNVVEAELNSAYLAWICLAEILLLEDFLLTELSVVVKVQFGIETNHF